MAHFDRVIPPGGEGKIKLSVDTEGYRNQISKSAIVTTNDPYYRMFGLGIKAEIITFIDIRPNKLVMRGDGTKKLTGELNITSQLDRPLVLTPESFSLEDRVAYTMEEVEKGKAFKLNFATKAVAETGYHGYLKIKTNFPEKPELRLKVSVNIKKQPPIKVSQHSLRIWGRMGKELTGEVVIEATRDQPLSITPGEQTFPEKLSYVVEEVEKGKKFKIKFVTEPAQRPETYRGSLTLTTNYKAQPVIRIKVLVQVK